MNMWLSLWSVGAIISQSQQRVFFCQGVEERRFANAVEHMFAIWISSPTSG